MKTLLIGLLVAGGGVLLLAGVVVCCVCFRAALRRHKRDDVEAVDGRPPRAEDGHREPAHTASVLRTAEDGDGEPAHTATVLRTAEDGHREPAHTASVLRSVDSSRGLVPTSIAEEVVRSADERRGGREQALDVLPAVVEPDLLPAVVELDYGGREIALDHGAVVDRARLEQPSYSLTVAVTAAVPSPDTTDGSGRSSYLDGIPGARRRQVYWYEEEDVGAVEQYEADSLGEAEYVGGLEQVEEDEEQYYAEDEASAGADVPPGEASPGGESEDEAYEGDDEATPVPETDSEEHYFGDNES